MEKSTAIGTLAQRHMIGHRLFVIEPIENFFCLQTAIFEIPL